MTDQSGREVIISVRGLAKSFGTHQIWDSLSLDVYRGEILAIVGGSGQGKSVLMRVITGLLKPDKGDVGLFGQDTKTLSPDARLDIYRPHNLRRLLLAHDLHSQLCGRLAVVSWAPPRRNIRRDSNSTEVAEEWAESLVACENSQWIQFVRGGWRQGFYRGRSG